MEYPRVNSVPGSAGPFRRIFASRWFKVSITIAGILLVLLMILVGVFFWMWGNPTPQTYGVALGDLDGDGDLDAFYANGQNEGPRSNTVLINQGRAAGSAWIFKDLGQRLGNEESRTALLADLDEDGDLDAWVANMGYQSFFWNDGLGNFSEGKHSVFEDPGGTGMWKVAVDDMDGDGDLDAVGAGCCGGIASYGDNKTEIFPPFNVVWYNQGGRQFGQAGDFRSDITMPSLGATDVALGDLDGDGDTDAFFANDWYTQSLAGEKDFENVQPNTIWMNPGDGILADSGQRLGSGHAQDVALGDLDGDGDLDAFVANRGADEVWLNSGGGQSGKPGIFTDSGQRLGSGDSMQVILSDLDGDSDLDAVLVVRNALHVEVWLNDGHGYFSDSGQRILHPQAQAYTLGDVDGDGDADLFAGWYETGYAVWWNRGNGTFTP